MTGYTGFSSVAEEQSGHYLALKFDCDPEADEISVNLVGGTKGPVTLDEDRMIVLRIKDPATQSIEVTAKKGSETTTETFDISGLVLG